ncbi:MAG TPA: restriction endonuclease subunit S, partial [Cyclobacteriaceae bacterium]|nr:restriction endonuclease subunit S [Cyclobacteriaceae bacterium]HNN23433.1 restriction endonuclease subunit S [Cyclobacteriaceae bacterium]
DNGDILIGMDGDFNISKWQGGKALLNQRVCKILGTKVHNSYLLYILPFSLKVINDLTYYTTVKHLSNEDLWNDVFPIPELEEQTAIANFLDDKTANIDKLISNKQKLIELLKEERTAIINEAVSGKGRNWGKKKLKYVAKKVQTGSTPPSNEEQYYVDEIKWFTPSDFSDDLFLQNSKRKIAELAVTNGIVKRFPANSVLFVGIGATLGKVGFILEPATSNQQINCLSFHSEEEAIFYANYFYSNQPNIIALANAATLAILNQSQMKDIILPVPSSFDELKEAVQNIQTEAQRIDNTVSKIEREIELMNEYRTALISEVVTGKVKVA